MASLITNVSVAGIFSAPNFQSQMISQSLLWEKLDILDKKDNWYRIKQFDNYEGWIHEFYITVSIKDVSKYVVYLETNSIANIFKEPNIGSTPIMNCTFGTIIPAIDTQNIDYLWWHKIILPNNQFGWIQDSGYKKSKSIRQTIIQIAMKLLGTPYVWGGRSSFGFDCSGFVQTIFKFCGIILPRDSKDQFKFPKLVEQKMENNKKGDLIFFAENDKINHIGIALENNQFLHSSGFVRTNSLNPYDTNFDKRLEKIYYSSMSIQKLI